jgi:DUF1009 family protein
MPGEGLAIVAGRGVLPRLIAEDCVRRGRPHVVVRLDGLAPGGEAFDWAAGHPVIEAVLEKPGRLFADLRRAGCHSVTFAGGVRRPALDPLRFDLTMLRLAPRLLTGLRGGDDAALRLIAGIFEAEGFAVRAPHELLADLIAAPGVPTRVQPGDADREDAARAAAIVAALGAADAGQGAVVAQGICLGLETIQGTDAMLDFVARTAGPYRPDPRGATGVLFKAPKPGQDWRLDLPAIGPATVAAAAAAGLAGIVVQAGGVLLLGREETLAAADAAGLFVWGREPG